MLDASRLLGGHGEKISQDVLAFRSRLMLELGQDKAPCLHPHVRFSLSFPSAGRVRPARSAVIEAADGHVDAREGACQGRQARRRGDARGCRQAPRLTGAIRTVPG